MLFIYFVVNSERGSQTENDSRLRVLDDIRELVWMQPDVHWLQHGAHCRQCIVQHEVPGVVPHERAHSVTGRDARFAQGRRQSSRSRLELTISDAVTAAVRSSDDFIVGLDATASFKQLAEV